MDWDFTPLTKRLNEAVINRGFTLEELSEKTGISVRTLKDYLAGKRYPRKTPFLKLLDALGVSSDYLLFPERKP